MSAELPRASSEGASPDRLIGQVLANRYRIEHRLGEGAMGTVYKAHHIKVGRPFAVKVLHARLLEDEKILQRFEREAELAGRLRHPNVIGVVDVGETPDGMHYMVMDFAEGPDMSALLGEAPMPPQRIIHIVRQLLEGLFHAHTAGLIHRDFKPENVIVEKDTNGSEVPRIVDFGIAILREGGDPTSGTGRLTTNGLVLGTPHYMAPEQAVNDPIDHRIDLFALGIMIYEMLSGKLPFDGNGAEVARANLMLDPPPISVRVPYLEVDPLLEAYARRLMSKSRDARPPTAKVARELLDVIERDREAAAALLGVPLAVTRSPRTTQPVAPRAASDDDYPGTFPPPLRDASATPPQAPAMDAPVARISHASDVAIRPISDRTEPVRLPVSQRKKLAVALLAGVALIAGSLALLSRNRATPAGPVAPAHLAEQPPPIVAPPPTPTPRPAVDPTPQVVADPPPPVKPAAVTGKVQPKIHPSPAIVEPPPPPTRPAIAQTIKPAVVVAPQPAPAIYDNDAFITQLNAVGAELQAFAETHPSTVGDLQTKFHRIDVNPTLGSPTRLKAARTALDEIHAELARRAK